MQLTLTKHHGLANDFLVLFDDQPLPELPLADLAVRLCNRRAGVGADGLIVGSAGDHGDGADVAMVLHNADGSRAEMSGNGVRCLAQAFVLRGGGHRGPVLVATDAGLREVAVTTTDDPHTVVASVDLGAVGRRPAPPDWPSVLADPARPVAHLSLGNPHTVVAVEEVALVDLATIGAKVPDVNLEVVQPGPEPTAIRVRVHERGVGITAACGTGAAAAGWAASEWGFVPSATGEIVVHMDGGDAKVLLDRPLPGHATLVGPATLVAIVSVPF